jgi:sulfur-oxidizing protein SoxX
MKSKLAIMAAALLLAGQGHAFADAVPPESVVFADGEVKQPVADNEADPEEGALVFASKSLGNCLACHANKDLKSQLFHGDVGPSLDGVGARWDEPAIRAIVVNSKAVFGPDTVMPGFYSLDVGVDVRKDLVGKTILTGEQVENLVAYLVTLKEE